MTAHNALPRELLDYPKVDVHTHIGLGAQPVSTAVVDRYIQDSVSVGITRLMISRPFTGPIEQMPGPDTFSRANDMVMELVQRYPGVVYGYAFVHAGYLAWSVREMDRCLSQPGMVGVKLYNQYRYDDPAVIALISEAAARDALVLLHQGKATDPDSLARQPNISDGLHIARLAREVPAARLILGHIGGGGDWEWTVKAVADSPTVYADTSGSVIDGGMIEFAVRQLGWRRLLFATDMSVDEGVGKILAARIPAAQKKAIFSGNYERLMKERR